MEDTRWQQLKDLFFEAVDKPTAERAAWVAQIDDAQLRADDADAATLLDVTHGRLAQLVEPLPHPAGLEQHMGPYRLLKEIGRGGMGTVYLAERADGAFEQQVALKVIRCGLDTTDGLRRFEQERQILAALYHENIARLYDGGTGKDGLPYFVMECIDGMPITTYCDKHRLSVDARLRLFQSACAAVQYAHQNLIVHRDLKPSNMLVTQDGQLKLLDFGIAKLLTEDQPDPLVTRTGVRVLTPAYASPEQLTGDTISTASDVYTLGVVLYELLTGQRPYTIPPDQEAGAFIDTVALQRPSTAVPETDDTEAIGTARSTTTERLRRRLSGDLDTIVLKALRKEPERRYTSAEALLDDLRRHLNGLPVRAQKDTLGYRVHKFVQRHRVGVLASALVLLSLLGGLGLALWQARAKTLEAARAQAVKTLVLDLFSQANPDVAQGEVLTALDLAAQGARRVREELTGQPEVQAEMLVVLAEVNRKLGTYDDALELLEDALAVRRVRYGDVHEQTAEVLDRLGVVQMDLGAYEVADSLLTEALRIRRARLGVESNEVAQSLHHLGTLLTRGRYQGRHEEATSFHRHALAIRRKLLHEDDPDLLKSQHSLAVALERQGDYAAAETLFRELVETHRRVLGPGHTETLLAMNNLAIVLSHQQQYDEAIALVRQTIAARKHTLGDAHPDVATSLRTLAGLLNNRDWPEDRAEVESLYRQALSIRRKAFGDDHPVVASTMASLSSILLERRRYEAAAKYAREALVLHRRTLGEEHQQLVIDQLYLAKALYASGALDEADRVFIEAHALALRTWPTDHLIIGSILVNHGQLLQVQGRVRQAEPMLEKGLRIVEEGVGPEHSETATAKLRLGLCHSARRHYAEAEPLLLDAYAFFSRRGDAEPEALADARAALVNLYTAWGRPEKAGAYQ